MSVDSNSDIQAAVEVSLSDLIKEQHRSFFHRNTLDEVEVSLVPSSEQVISSSLKDQDSSELSLGPYLIEGRVSGKDEIGDIPSPVRKDYHGLHSFSDRRDEEVQEKPSLLDVPLVGGILFEPANIGEGSAVKGASFSEEISSAKDLIPTDLVHSFYPLPAEVNKDDPRRVLLKDAFNFTIEKYNSILNSSLGVSDVINRTLIEHKITHKYFYNEILARLDVQIAAEGKDFDSSNEYVGRVALVDSFLEVRKNNGREIFGDTLSIVKSKKLRAELNQGLKE